MDRSHYRDLSLGPDAQVFSVQERTNGHPLLPSVPEPARQLPRLVGLSLGRYGPYCLNQSPRRRQCSPHAPREAPHAEREDYTGPLVGFDLGGPHHPHVVNMDESFGDSSSRNKKRSAEPPGSPDSHPERRHRGIVESRWAAPAAARHRGRRTEFIPFCGAWFSNGMNSVLR
jgi:hypothetical protein